MQNFMIDNQDTFITIGILAFLFSIGWFVVHAKKKNWFTQEDVQDVKHTIEMVQLLTSFFKIDEKFTVQTYTIFDACRQALTYATDIMNVTDDETKRKIIYDAVVESLKKLNVKIDENKINLIKVGIDLAIVKAKDLQK